MTDDIPQIILGLGNDSEYVVMIGEAETEATTLDKLFSLAPELKNPAAAVEAARAVNHLSQGQDFEVIEDPAAFEKKFRETLASEDPSAPWREGVIRLSDYGTPDFAAIKKPAMNGTVLTFFAEDTVLGLPYRVEVDLASVPIRVTDGDYKALELDPLDFGQEDQMPTPLNDEDDPLGKLMEVGPAKTD